MTAPNRPDFDAAFMPVSRRWDTSRWEVTGTFSLSAAGASAALLLLLAQIKVETRPLEVCMWCASIALPMWIGFWAISDTYTFWGKSAESHYKKRGWMVAFVVSFFTASLLLFAGIAALLWSLLAGAAVAFISISMLIAAVVGWHNVHVSRFAKTIDAQSAAPAPQPQPQPNGILQKRGGRKPRT